MGYRAITTDSNGNATTAGTTSGGGEDISCIKEVFLLGYLHKLYQKSVTETKRVAGVSLADAKKFHAALSLKDFKLTQAAGQSVSWTYALSCCGTKKRVNYQQIGDSNLYVVNIENATLSCSENGTTWYANGKTS